MTSEERTMRRFVSRTDPTLFVEAWRDVATPDVVNFVGLVDDPGTMTPDEFRMFYRRDRLTEIGLADVPASKNIAAVGYDPAVWQLLVEFRPRGAVYLFDNVPPDVAAPLVAAVGNEKPETSAGSYFSDRIRAHPNEYPYVKLETSPGGD